MEHIESLDLKLVPSVVEQLITSVYYNTKNITISERNGMIDYVIVLNYQVKLAQDEFYERQGVQASSFSHETAENQEKLDQLGKLQDTKLPGTIPIMESHKKELLDLVKSVVTFLVSNPCLTDEYRYSKVNEFANHLKLDKKTLDTIIETTSI